MKGMSSTALSSFSRTSHRITLLNQTYAEYRRHRSIGLGSTWQASQLDEGACSSPSNCCTFLQRTKLQIPIIDPTRVEWRQCVQSRFLDDISGGRREANLQPSVLTRRTHTTRGYIQGRMDLFSNSRDTIFALSSGAGRAGVAVLRVSGPQANQVQLLLRQHRLLPPARVAQTAKLYHPATRELLDHALVLWFPGPNSATGEDVVELHVHGGPAVVRATLDALAALPGFRLAEPGEYMRRAFDAGLVDLTQIEGVADLLAADTAAQHRMALQQSSGTLRCMLEAWRRELLSCLARTEAVIDFGEDEEIGDEVLLSVQDKVVSLREQIRAHLLDARRGELLREGVRVALVGPANAGKSSMLNLLAGRDVAIVSSFPGTTRDVLEVNLDLGGYKVVLSDSAGVRGTSNPVEQEGISRSLHAAARADVCVLVLDVTEVDAASKRAMDSNAYPRESAGSECDPETSTPKPSSTDNRAWYHNELVEATRQLVASRRRQSAQCPRREPLSSMVVLNKADLLAAGSSSSTVSVHTMWVAELLAQLSEEGPGEEAGGSDALAKQAVHVVSCRSGFGVAEFLQALQSTVELVCQGADTTSDASRSTLTRLRHRQHLQACYDALERYSAAGRHSELGAEELRAAAVSLGKITGVIDVEDVLEVIFSEFCIGK